jgi:histidine ammonia-lyase
MTVVGPAYPEAGADDGRAAWSPVVELVARSSWRAALRADPAVRARMTRARDRLEAWADERPVYGTTSGFGPLVGHAADPDPARQAEGLIAHLSVGQGAALSVDVVRTMVWLRLAGMTLGHSGVALPVWDTLVDQWNRGFTPVVPRDGSVSASGDLVPLAHAAAAAAGNGEAWVRGAGTWRPLPAGEALRRIGASPVRWDARSSLAFVNGTSASLAQALHNHLRLAAMARACAAVTARVVELLGCGREPYADQVARVRGHRGHRAAAAWIRRGVGESAPSPARPLQEPYSLRCAPQVVGAVLDQLRLQGGVLVAEANGCTDNPVLVDDRVWHGGNFHAAPVGLASEQHALCLHQLAFLAERQLALVLDPRHNGDLPPLLAARPGRTSGFAGAQLAATAHLGFIRQRCVPASTTAVPTNLGNQDHVPMALNSAVAVTETLERAWWIVGSLLLAVTQLARLTPRASWPAADPLWRTLADRHPDLVADRPLAGEIADAAWLAEDAYTADMSTRGTEVGDHAPTIVD